MLYILYFGTFKNIRITFYINLSLPYSPLLEVLIGHKSTLSHSRPTSPSNFIAKILWIIFKNKTSWNISDKHLTNSTETEKNVGILSFCGTKRDINIQKGRDEKEMIKRRRKRHRRI